MDGQSENHSTSAASSQTHLPGGWVKKFSVRKNRFYYYNKEKGRLTWQVPEDTEVASSVASKGNDSQKGKPRERTKSPSKDSGLVSPRSSRRRRASGSDTETASTSKRSRVDTTVSNTTQNSNSSTQWTPDVMRVRMAKVSMILKKQRERQKEKKASPKKNPAVETKGARGSDGTGSSASNRLKKGKEQGQSDTDTDKSNPLKSNCKQEKNESRKTRASKITDLDSVACIEKSDSKVLVHTSGATVSSELLCDTKLLLPNVKYHSSLQVIKTMTINVTKAAVNFKGKRPASTSTVAVSAAETLSDTLPKTRDSIKFRIPKINGRKPIGSISRTPHIVQPENREHLSVKEKKTEPKPTKPSEPPSSGLSVRGYCPQSSANQSPTVRRPSRDEDMLLVSGPHTAPCSSTPCSPASCAAACSRDEEPSALCEMEATPSPATATENSDALACFRQNNDLNESQEDMDVEIQTVTSSTQLTQPEKLAVVLDTNVLIHDLPLINRLVRAELSGFRNLTVVVPWQVLQELDAIKMSTKRKSPFPDAENLSQVKNLHWAVLDAIDTLNKLLEKKHPQVIGQTPQQDRESSLLPGAISDSKLKDDSILNCCVQWAALHPDTCVLFLSNDKNLRSKAVVTQVMVLSSKALPVYLERQGSRLSNGNVSPATGQRVTTASPSLIGCPSHANLQSNAARVSPVNLSQQNLSRGGFGQVINSPTSDARDDDVIMMPGDVVAQFSSSTPRNLPRPTPRQTPASVGASTPSCSHSTSPPPALGVRDRNISSPVPPASARRSPVLPEAPCSSLATAERDLVIEAFYAFHEVFMEGLSTVLEREMSEIYGDLWLHVVLVKPPWTLRELYKCFSKHWLAVFSPSFSQVTNELIHSVIDQYELGFKHRAFASKRALKCVGGGVKVLQDFRTKPCYKSGAVSQALDSLQVLTQVLTKLEINNIHSLSEDLTGFPELNNKLQLYKDVLRQHVDSLNAGCCRERSSVLGHMSAILDQDTMMAMGGAELDAGGSRLENRTPSLDSFETNTVIEPQAQTTTHSTVQDLPPRIPCPEHFSVLGSAVRHYQERFYSSLEQSERLAPEHRATTLRSLALLCANTWLFTQAYERIVTNGVNPTNVAELCQTINHFAKEINIEEWPAFTPALAAGFFGYAENGGAVASGLGELRALLHDCQRFTDVLTPQERDQVAEFTNTYRVT